MKILLTIFVLFFSFSAFSETVYCNVEAHGFDRDKWRDYPDNIFIITYNNNTLTKTDTMINLSKTYDVIKNNNNVVIGIILDEKSGAPGVSTLRSITIHKDTGNIITLYNDDLGVTINMGKCFNY